LDSHQRCSSKDALQVSPELARSLAGGPLESSRALRQLLKDNGVELPVGASDAECARQAMNQAWPDQFRDAIMKICVMLLGALMLSEAMKSGAEPGQSGSEPSARKIRHANDGKDRARELHQRLPTPTGPKVGVDPKPSWLDPQPKVGVDPKPSWLDPQPVDPAKVRADDKTRGDVKMLARTVEDCAKDGWMDQPTAEGFRARLQGLSGKLADGAPISEATQKEVDQLAGDIFRAEFGSPGKTDGAKVTETLLKSVDEIRGKALATRDEASSLRERIQALGQEVSGPVDAAWIARANQLRREIVDTARSHAGKGDVPLE
jgi:hypothetical protein